ncbi:MAG TPA: hypothetical protein VFC46_13590, partial [Humisphaera sp.]|nr:hypothetical protein [Humisphaera sp.]
METTPMTPLSKFNIAYDAAFKRNAFDAVNAENNLEIFREHHPEVFALITAIEDQTDADESKLDRLIQKRSTIVSGVDVRSGAQNAGTLGRLRTDLQIEKNNMQARPSAALEKSIARIERAIEDAQVEVARLDAAIKSMKTTKAAFGSEEVRKGLAAIPPRAVIVRKAHKLDKKNTVESVRAALEDVRTRRSKAENEIGAIGDASDTRDVVQSKTVAWFERQRARAAKFSVLPLRRPGITEPKVPLNGNLDVTEIDGFAMMLQTPAIYDAMVAAALDQFKSVD